MNRMSTEIENNEPKIVSVFGGQEQIKNFGKNSKHRVETITTINLAKLESLAKILRVLF